MRNVLLRDGVTFVPTWRELEQLKRLAWGAALVMDVLGGVVLETRRVGQCRADKQ